jgi:hypothetical protein
LPKYYQTQGYSLAREAEHGQRWLFIMARPAERLLV